MGPEKSPNPSETSESFRFGPYQFLSKDRILLRNGTAIDLKPKELDLLTLFVGQPGKLLTKEQIMEALWPDTIVEESNLSVQISALRRVLGDDPSRGDYIETVPRRGYRFRMDVSSLPPVGPHGIPPSSPQGPLFRGKWGIFILATLLTLLIGTTVAFIVIPTPSTWVPIPLAISPDLETGPALSPEGDRVIYDVLETAPQGARTGKTGLWLQTIGGGPPVQVTKGSDTNPAWSPDGREFAYIHLINELPPQYRMQLVVRSAFGGNDQVLVDNLGYGGPRPGPGVSYTPDGKWLLTSLGTGFFPGSVPRHLVAVSRDSGEIRPILDPPTGFAGDSNPVLSPTGDHLYFCRCLMTNSCGLFQVRMKGLTPAGPPQALTDIPSPEMRIAVLPDGSVIYPLGPPDTRSLWRTSFDLLGRQVNRRVSPMGQDVRQPSAVRLPNGKIRLVHVRNNLDLNIWRVTFASPDGKPVKTEALIRSNETDEGPSYSPDGKRIAFASTRTGVWEIWIADANGENARQLTHLGPAYTRNPAWSADGQWVAFETRGKAHTQIMVIPLSGGDAVPVTAGEFSNIDAAWSPDRRWLYFASNRTGRYEVYRVPAPRNGVAIPAPEQITTEGGSSPQLSPFENVMIYRDSRQEYRRMNLATHLSEAPPEIEIVTPPIPGPGNLSYAMLREGNAGFLVRFDWRTGVYENLFRPRFTRPAGMARSPDGRSVLFVSVDHSDSDLILVDDLRY